MAIRHSYMHAFQRMKAFRYKLDKRVNIMQIMIQATSDQNLGDSVSHQEEEKEACILTIVLISIILSVI